MLTKGIKASVLAVVILAVNVVPALAGAVGGPKGGEYRIAAHSYRTFSVRFYANEVARVEVEGDGDTDLDLYIYDEYGRLVASDGDYTDYCVAEWFPYRTQTYTIKVVNRGNVYNACTIKTN